MKIFFRRSTEEPVRRVAERNNKEPAEFEAGEVAAAEEEDEEDEEQDC